MFAVGHNFSVLMLSRVIGGMSAGMVMPVTGLIADVSPSHQKQKLWLHVSDYQFWIHFRTRDWWIYGRSFTSYAILFAGALGILAFIMSVVLIHDPKNLRQVVSKT